MLTNIDKTLIEHELSNDIRNGFIFKYKKLSNRFVDWLFNHYYTVECSIHFYDMMDGDTGRYRKDFCNWIDPYGEGIWDMSQNAVDKMAKRLLKSVKNKPVKHKDRIYYAEKDGYILIYWYGRDFMQEDYWWVFRKSGLENEGWRFS